MSFIERAAGIIGVNKHEKVPRIITAKTFDEFSRLLNRELAGVVCVFPWKEIKPGNIRYGLDYFSESILTKQQLFFQEIFDKIEPNDENDLRNRITAISRLNLVEKLSDINGYIVKDSGYLADPIDPEIYSNALYLAEKKGIKPFPLPIPKAFTN